MASEDYLDFSNTNYKEPNFEPIEDLYDHLLDAKLYRSSDAKLLSDRKPQLTKLYTKAAREWKLGYNQYYATHFYKKD